MSEWNEFFGKSIKPLLEMVESHGLKRDDFKTRQILLFIAFLVVAALLGTSWYTVQPEETGIVQRFGKVMRSAGPGLHFKLPLGIETVRLLPTARVLKEEFGFRTMSSLPGEKTRYEPSGSYKEESLMPTGGYRKSRVPLMHGLPGFMVPPILSILIFMPSCRLLRATKRSRTRILCSSSPQKVIFTNTSKRRILMECSRHRRPHPGEWTLNNASRPEAAQGGNIWA